MLPIFPEGGLASSVITTVWVGVFVLCFFNLRYGWVLSGLVVPGYIVPLLIVKPIAAAVITVEAILTYLIVIAFSEYIGRGRWSSLFGRDRFMALILASIAVRLSMDGFILPLLADWLAENWDRQFDWQSNFQSFGLVIISLLANQFWKPGLAKGLYATVVVTFLTWLFVRYGLMELTNFHMSGVSYMFEGLASSILASPKAYIILVLTALVASQMNVRYGWDFSGILIPALIALQWYQPTKILTSFVEAAIIYIIARLVLKLPAVANANIEGARKLLLFFNISFVYKLILGHAAVFLALDVKTSDLYGFGYLLSTLIAIKAHDKDIFPRLMRSTLEISLAGAVLGNLAGFLITTLTPQALFSFARSKPAAKNGLENKADALIAAAIGAAHLQSRQSNVKPLSTETAEAMTAMIEIFEADPQAAKANGSIVADGIRVESTGDGTMAIMRGDGEGRDLLLFNPEGHRRIAISVPDPTQASGLGAAGLALFRSENARWLVISSAPEPGVIADQTVLGLFRSASKLPELVLTAARMPEKPVVRLERGAARTLDLASLRRKLPGLRASFDIVSNADKAAVSDDRALLELDRISIDRLMQGLVAPAAMSSEKAALQPCMIKPEKTGAQRLSDLATLAFLRFEVAEPLLARLMEKQSPTALKSNAALIGFSLENCLLGSSRQWQLGAVHGNEGVYLFAADGNRTRVIHSFAAADQRAIEAGRSLHEIWRSALLAVAPDQRSMRLSQKNSFGVITQAAIRAMGEKPGEVVQLQTARFSAPNPATDVDMVIALDYIGVSDDRSQQMLSIARNAGFRPVLADRTNMMAGYEKAANQAVLYLEQSANKRHTTFWLRRKLPVGEE
ncbi:MAG: poly-gamma-glutamate biosynthesis protein PgsC/CapC [Sphingorhabdus sp.]